MSKLSSLAAARDVDRAARQNIADHWRHHAACCRIGQAARGTALLTRGPSILAAMSGLVLIAGGRAASRPHLQPSMRPRDRMRAHRDFMSADEPFSSATPVGLRHNLLPLSIPSCFVSTTRHFNAPQRHYGHHPGTLPAWSLVTSHGTRSTL